MSFTYEPSGIAGSNYRVMTNQFKTAQANTVPWRILLAVFVTTTTEIASAIVQALFM